MSTWVDYKGIRERISMEHVLEHYGVLGTLHEKGDSLVGACPIHKGTNPNQFHVSRSTGKFNCFGDCHGGGIGALDFAILMEGGDKDNRDDTRAAALKLMDWFGLEFDRPQGGRRKATPDETAGKRAREKELTVAPSEDVPGDPPAALPAEPPATGIPVTVNVPLKFALKNLDPNHQYLTERGFAKETIAHFGLGFCTKGIMANRIAIPIHNEQGELVAYAGRWSGEPPEGEGKYKLPTGFHKSLVVYNLHRACEYAKEGGLIVVEGFFDCLRVWSAGFPNVVALMGSSLSDEQAALIIDAVGPKGKVALMFDEDDAGWKGREEALTRLADKVYVKVIGLGEEGRQPDTVPESELKTALLGL